MTRQRKSKERDSKRGGRGSEGQSGDRRRVHGASIREQGGAERSKGRDIVIYDKAQT